MEWKRKNYWGYGDEVGKDISEKINLAIIYYVIKAIFIYFLSVFPTGMEVPWGQALPLLLYMYMNSVCHIVWDQWIFIEGKNQQPDQPMNEALSLHLFTDETI